MTLLTIAIMFAALIGILYCKKVQKTNPHAKLLALLCVFAICGCGVKFVIDQGLFGDSRWRKLQQNSDMRINEAAAKMIGDYLSEKFPQEKIMIVASGGNDFAAKLADQPLPEQVKRYLKSADVTIRGLPYTPNPEGEYLAEENATAKYYNQLFQENPDTKLFIFTFSLPFDIGEVGKLSVWRKKGGQKIALINSDIRFFADQLMKGTIAAAVVLKGDLNPEELEELAPDDLEKAFQTKYVFLTPENIGTQWSAAYSGVGL